MKKYVICLGIWIVVVGQAFGQKAVIKGRISSGKNEAVVGANVVLKGTVRGVQTNSQGEYIIKGLASGNYTIEVSYVGFRNKEFTLELAESQTSTINFQLEAEGLALDEVTILTSRGIRGNETLAETQDYSIYAGKKNEVIQLANINANLAMNNSRQIFSRTPGISVWENDGSGIQLCCFPWLKSESLLGI